MITATVIRAYSHAHILIATRMVTSECTEDNEKRKKADCDRREFKNVRSVYKYGISKHLQQVSSKRHSVFYCSLMYGAALQTPHAAREMHGKFTSVHFVCIGVHDAMHSSVRCTLYVYQRSFSAPYNRNSAPLTCARRQRKHTHSDSTVSFYLHKTGMGVRVSVEQRAHCKRQAVAREELPSIHCELDLPCKAYACIQLDVCSPACTRGNIPFGL